MIKTILVTLDGSRAAEIVLPYAEFIASRTGAALHLLTVAREESAGDGPITYLSEKADQLRSRSLSCTTDVVIGDEADAILAQAEAKNADMIAMSTFGRSGFRRWVLGSVAHKLVHGSSRPLLLARSRETSGRPVRSLDPILVPLDGSDISLGVLPFVEELAGALDAGLVLHTAVSPIDPFPGAGIPLGEVGTLTKSLVGQCELVLAQLAEQIKARSKLKARSVVSSGFTVVEIVRTSQEVNAGLIAMSTHGRSGIDRWVTGSVAEGVVRRSALPCLLMRPKEAVQRD
jgi:nucleotide-binding universal stress UspA family protein